MKKIIYLLSPFICLATLLSCGGNKPDSNTCTVTWMNDDSTVLLTQTYNKGDKPSYPYGIPSKEDNQYYYSFSNWDKEITNVYTDTVYTAEYYDKFNIEESVLTIDVTEDDYSFEFKDIKGKDGSYSINWGDGTSDTNQPKHTYKNLGIYDIVLTNVTSFDIKKEQNISYLGLGDLITELNPNAFEGKTELKSIRFSQKLTSIAKTLFAECTSIQNVKFPNSITEIGAGAFDGCKSIKAIEFNTNIKTIGGNAFSGCESLKKLFIPKSVESIGSYAFKSCASLEEIKVDPSNEYYTSGDNNNNVLIDKNNNVLLQGCNNSIIPTGVTELAVSSFENCTNLKSIDVPNTVTKIKDYAFRNCHQLQTITIPDSVTSFGSTIFYQCAKLGTIHIPNSLKEIPFECFYRCFRLDNITIPPSVTKIGTNAFSFCSFMESIFIPKTVSNMDSDAFLACTSLTINCEAESKPDGWNEGWYKDVKGVNWGCKPE